MTTAPSPRVVVLAGGLSHERDVSLRSGRRVADALRVRRASTSRCTTSTPTWCPRSSQLQPDVVWPLLHGASGEDGSVRDVVQLLGLRLLGTGPRESRVAWSKPIAKTVVARAGLATPDFVTLPQSLFRELGARQVLDGDRRPPRPAARRQAVARRLGARGHAGDQRRGAPAGDGRLLRLQRHRAHRAGRRPAPRSPSPSSTSATARRAPRRRDRHRRPLRLRRPLQPRPDRVLRAGPAVCRRSPGGSPTSRSPRTAPSGSSGLSRTDLIVDDDGHRLVPRGQRRPGDDRDVAAPAGRRGRRAAARRAVPVVDRRCARPLTCANGCYVRNVLPHMYRFSPSAGPGPRARGWRGSG